MCRRAHGAGYVTWIGFAADHFRLLEGEERLQWSESSPGARRGFCGSCGSTMLFESKRWAGETHVALACIDDPVDRTPQAHVFFDSHVDWIPIDETLKVFSG
jgi:hypothetical protein